MDQLQDIAQVRRIYTALTLHYVDGLTQAQVAERMGQSHSTVNRMIKAGHDMGMVESIHLCLFHWVLNDVYARINQEGRHAE